MTSPCSLKNLLSCGLLVALPFVAGCRGPAALQTSFYQYSEAYATTVNEQMLLNLARRANGHPASFLQMGLVNSTFSFSASAAGNVSGVRARNQIGRGIVTQVLTSGGSLSLTAVETPTFTFTPLAGGTFAEAIFAPISPIIFFNLLEQGERVDLLMRTMVHSVELIYTMTNGTQRSVFVRNVLDHERQENFRNFLRLAAIYRELQKAELLTVRASTNEMIGFGFRPGYRQKVRELVQNPQFRLEPESEWAALQPNEMLIDEIPEVRLQLRTFEGVLTALGTEDRLWKRVMQGGQSAIPESQQSSILRFEGKENYDPSTRLVEVHYRGKRYQVADTSPEDKRNRDAFNLLNYLFTQVSMDPNKLPVQQLIQVR